MEFLEGPEVRFQPPKGGASFAMTTREMPTGKRPLRAWEDLARETVWTRLGSAAGTHFLPQEAERVLWDLLGL